MSANNDSYVPLQKLYNSSKRTLQIIVRPGNPKFASRDSDVPIRMSRIVNLFPGRTLNIEPSRVDEAQLSRYQSNISIQVNRTSSIGVLPSKTPTIYVFNGTFYLECPNPIGLPAYNQERSMFGWVKPAKAPDGHQALFGYGPSDTSLPFSHSMLVYNWGGRRDVEFWGSSALNRSPSQNVLVPDRWNFVGLTWNGRTLTTYVNGLSWSIPAHSLNTNVEVFRVGFSMTTSPDLFIGDIKSVSVWDVAKDREYVQMLREAGPVSYNEVPPQLFGENNLTDCIISNNLFEIVGLDVLTPPGPASDLEAGIGKEYEISEIKTAQFEFITSNMTDDGSNNVAVMSKDYELSMIVTSGDQTIGGSGGHDAFYARSVTLTETVLQFNSRSSLPIQSIEVYSDGSLSDLSSRSISNIPVFSLSARVQADPEQSQLLTSDNTVLQFNNSTFYGPISYWDLTEIGNVNTDSVSGNDLVKMAI